MGQEGFADAEESREKPYWEITGSSLTMKWCYWKKTKKRKRTVKWHTQKSHICRTLVSLKHLFCLTQVWPPLGYCICSGNHRKPEIFQQMRCQSDQSNKHEWAVMIKSWLQIKRTTANVQGIEPFSSALSIWIGLWLMGPESLSLSLGCSMWNELVVSVQFLVHRCTFPKDIIFWLLAVLFIVKVDFFTSFSN